MQEFWPQLLVLVLLLGGFLFLILRLRPGPQTSFPPTGSDTTRRIAVRLDRSPLVVILLALIAILILVLLVHVAYRVSQRNRGGVVPPYSDVQALMAQLNTQLEEYFRQHGAYPERLEQLQPLAQAHMLPAMDKFRDPVALLDYRSDGVSWWLLRSYGPDRCDGIPGKPFPLDTYKGQRLDSPAVREFLFDPTNGMNSTGDILLVGGEARAPDR